mgnify:CR=1 FL=1
MQVEAAPMGLTSRSESLLLDWMLPGVSGLEICHIARQRWDALRLPILALYALFLVGPTAMLIEIWLESRRPVVLQESNAT